MGSVVDMPAQPITVTLTDGQKLDVLKRLRKRYADEVERVEASVVEILTAVAEAEFLTQYVGEQPEVKELRARKAELETLELRRQYLSKLIDRLDAVTPDQPDVKAPPPSGVHPAQPARSGLRRY